MICVFLLVGAALLIINLVGQPVIRVHNEGSPVQDVVVSGTGFQMRLGDLASGQSTSVVLAGVRAENSFKISYSLGGNRIDLGDLAYLESSNGYCVDIVLKNDSAVVKTAAPLCFEWRRLIPRS
jgi:hypothetical protein